MTTKYIENEMHGMAKNVQKSDIGNISVSSIASELMKDQILEVVRTAEMKQLRVIENYIDGETLKAVLSFIKDKKTCETFDVVDTLDYDAKEICKVLDFLEATGKIKLE